MRKLLYKRHKLIGNKGFSLVELIIVIAIMAVLMAVLAPQLIKYVEKSRVQTDDTFMSELKHTVELACSDDVIYSGLSMTDTNTVTWTCADATGPIAVAMTNTDAAAAMTTAITTTIGSMAHKAASKTYQNATSAYVITISVSNDGVVTLTDPKPTIA